jgi:molecular chaperone DnaK
VAARNKADATLHSVDKALKDLGDKVTEDEKKAANDAIAEVRTAMSGDDREEIERKTASLEQASSAILQKMYQQQAQAAGASGAGASGEHAEAAAPKDDVLDAEFEEVKDSDRKKA